MKAHVTMNTEYNNVNDSSSDILEEFFGGGGQFQQVKKKAMRRPGRNHVKNVTLQSISSGNNDDMSSVGSPSSISSKNSIQSNTKNERKRVRLRDVKSDKDVKDLHLDDRNVVSDLIHRVTQLSGKH